MSSLREAPHSFDSLHTLGVWALKSARLLLAHHEVLNGSCTYQNSEWYWPKDPARTPEDMRTQIFDSLTGGTKVVRLTVQDRRDNTFLLEAVVTSATRVSESQSDGWVLVLEGDLSRWSGDVNLTLPVKIAGYFEISSGNGFCVLPHEARARLWSRNS